MMTKNDRDNLLKAEIAVYEDFLKVLKEVKFAVQKFDGKVYDKRFVESIDKFLNAGSDKRAYYVSDEFRLYDGYEINIHKCFDVSIKLEGYEGKDYVPSHNVRNSIIYIYMKRDDCFTFTRNEGKKDRVNAAGIIAAIAAKEAEIKEAIETRKAGLECAEKMIDDFMNLVEAFNVLNKKYDYAIRQTYDCCYRLENATDYNFR